MFQQSQEIKDLVQNDSWGICKLLVLDLSLTLLQILFCIQTWYYISLNKSKSLMCLNICSKNIADASDEAARKYPDKTSKEERTDAGVTMVIQAAVRSKTSSLRRQYAKHGCHIWRTWEKTCRITMWWKNVRSNMSIRYLTSSYKNRITCLDLFLWFTPY